MLAEAQRLLDNFDPTDHPLTTFNTGPDEHIGDDYFLNSNDKASLRSPSCMNDG